MENQTGLELSLRRVALLGSEVLERASRRRADCADSGPRLRPLTTVQKHGQDPLERTHRSKPLDQTHLDDLDQAFETMGALMVQSRHQCMVRRLMLYSLSDIHRVHRPDGCSELSVAERRHATRFHRTVGRTHTPGSRTEGRPPQSAAAYSDFHIEVSPGTYTITAGLPQAHQQAQRVSLHAGDSITLNFDLSPLS
ncbi:A-kinase-interacting protein 1 isoform X1 [Gadus morhua]|uniref:A-kinase-interacting protein 1 isoform X1 n=1 Tax=Gadus morhua TaxID=8049 RepID=UPI0011B4F947|nr:A-kinase-interacting protein 1 isoform X1 [Gadus morhua]